MASITQVKIVGSGTTKEEENKERSEHLGSLFRTAQALKGSTFKYMGTRAPESHEAGPWYRLRFWTILMFSSPIYIVFHLRYYKNVICDYGEARDGFFGKGEMFSFRIVKNSKSLLNQVCCFKRWEGWE